MKQYIVLLYMISKICQFLENAKHLKTMCTSIIHAYMYIIDTYNKYRYVNIIFICICERVMWKHHVAPFMITPFMSQHPKYMCAHLE